MFACLFIITSIAQAITIPTVPVGNPGNPSDSTSFGSVGYNYRIGKYEVTNAQYVEFLNGVDPIGANTLALYNASMTSDDRGGINFNGGAAIGSKYEIKPGRDHNPVVYVSWYDAIRFANWLHNGQGGGDTENGAYALLGGTPTPSNGNSITRSPGAKWWLPSENEWYKAAYHKNDGVTGNYWGYPTSTDVVPYSDQPPGSDTPDPSNTANFFRNDNVANSYNDGYAVTGSPSLVSSQNYLTDVGAFSSTLSPYGTFDQGGNAWEWNEVTFTGPSFRGLRGGSWGAGAINLSALDRVVFYAADASSLIGFRVASVPEPSSIYLVALGMVAVQWWRRTT
jgi:formylglycine-generating enzyme